MFRVENVILSDEIATAKFACNLPKCGGSCCVVGNAGAPVAKSEIPVLFKTYEILKEELNEEIRDHVAINGLLRENRRSGYELSCVNDQECIFVTYDEKGIAKCAIQDAYLNDRISWEKPMSCHLFPLRIKKVVDFDYVNFEYNPDLCSAACEKGNREGIYLSDFVKIPLIRRYGEAWYDKFLKACQKVRDDFILESRLC